jgi:DNA-binding response OmpR family regulator
LTSVDGTGPNIATLILNASPDSILLHHRAKILNRAGYYTSSARTLEEALQFARTMHCTLALICYNFASAERKLLARRLSRVNPSMGILCLDSEVDKNQRVLISRIESALARLTA